MYPDRMQNLIGSTYGKYNAFNTRTTKGGQNQLNTSFPHKISESVLKCLYQSLASSPGIPLYL